MVHELFYILAYPFGLGEHDVAAGQYLWFSCVDMMMAN